jgi:hypothetical protein
VYPKEQRCSSLVTRKEGMTPIKQAYPLAQLSLLKKMICPPAGENTSGDVPHQALSLTLRERWPRQRHRGTSLVHSDSTVGAPHDCLIGLCLQGFEILSRRSCLSFTGLKTLAPLHLMLNMRTGIDENRRSTQTPGKHKAINN